MKEDSTSGPISNIFDNAYSEFSNFSLLYQNGHSVLYRAQRYGRNFILKFLSHEFNLSGSRDLLKKEFELTLQLEHPNIIRVFSFENVDGMGQCIVMEYVDGINLNEWLETSPSTEDRKRIYLQILDAVSYIHSHQIVHRDLKPSNIIITRNGNNVKIIDFGYSDADSFAVFKQTAGTYKYMSPEQKNADSIIDARSDIYSLGILLSEIFPGGYSHIINKCKKENPSERYDNISQLKEAFLKRSKFSYIIYGGLGLLLSIICVCLFNEYIYESRLKDKAMIDSIPMIAVDVDKIYSVDTLKKSEIEVGETSHTHKDSIPVSKRINEISKETEEKCNEIKESFDKLLKDSEYQELYEISAARLFNKNVLEFYKRVVESDWTKKEYSVYYRVYEENSKCYNEALKKSNLPSYTNLFYKDREKTFMYDSLKKVEKTITESIPFDSITEYNSKFFKWSQNK